MLGNSTLRSAGSFSQAAQKALDLEYSRFGNLTTCSESSRQNAF